MSTRDDFRDVANRRVKMSDFIEKELARQAALAICETSEREDRQQRLAFHRVQSTILHRHVMPIVRMLDELNDVCRKEYYMQDGYTIFDVEIKQTEYEPGKTPAVEMTVIRGAGAPGCSDWEDYTCRFEESGIAGGLYGYSLYQGPRKEIKQSEAFKFLVKTLDKFLPTKRDIQGRRAYIAAHQKLRHFKDIKLPKRGRGN